MSQFKYMIFGIHAVSALLENQPERVLSLILQKERQDQKLQDIQKLARQQGIAVDVQPRVNLDKLTQDANHQGVIAYSQPPKHYHEDDLADLLAGSDKVPLVLVLDGVQDPHNLGACFRSADAAGVSAIIVPKDNAVGITAVVAKVACGACETVPFVQVTNLRRSLDKLKELGCWIYGAAGEAEQDLYASDFKGPTAIVLGAEGKGLRRLTRECCDVLLKIPMQGSVSSLNVSVATGVFLFEARRQRS